MLYNENRKLKVFLCHASEDKPKVQILYTRLTNDGVDAWLDKEKLLPGENWQIEIPEAVKKSDVVLVCLSSQSINKEGFVQKEIKTALDVADEKPDGTIFIIPARLENCNIPGRISEFQWVDLFLDDGYERLLKSLKSRADAVGAIFEPSKKEQPSNKIESKKQSKKISQHEQRLSNSRPKNQSKTKPPDVESMEKEILKEMLELRKLEIILQEPIKIGVFIGGAILYIFFLGIVFFIIAPLIFDTKDSVTYWISLGTMVITSFSAAGKMYLDKKKNTKESIIRTEAKILKLRQELRSLTEKH